MRCHRGMSSLALVGVALDVEGSTERYCASASTLSYAVHSLEENSSHVGIQCMHHQETNP